MWISELWRYPVKSMAGEALERAELTENGITGDRIVHVRHSKGYVVTSRTRPRLLGHRATLGPQGEPLVDGRPWNSAEVHQDVVAAVGAEAEMVRYEGLERFDVLPLLIATDGAISDFGYDRRRLRPNIVVAGVEGLAERQWPGRQLRVGEALIGVQDLRERCIMTTFDPDSLQQDVEVLGHIRQKFGGKLALNCYVVRGGTLAVGALVELV
jgi:uncharacterized protein YcbX